MAHVKLSLSFACIFNLPAMAVAVSLSFKAARVSRTQQRHTSSKTEKDNH
jgi:hypothetical protein